MLEIEMKFRIEDSNAYEKLLKSTLGVTLGPATTESDVFFTNEALGFPNQGKALRIRRRGNYLAATFKGPRLDSETKTREEIELTLVDERKEQTEENALRVEKARKEWIRFYERLGFLPYGEVNKSRRRGRVEFMGRQLEITLDTIDGLGSFTELEATAEKEEYEEARGVVIVLAKKLGLTVSITRSYLSLIYSQDRYINEHDSK